MTLDVITLLAVSISDSKENSGLGSKAMARAKRRNLGPKHHEKCIDDIFYAGYYQDGNNLQWCIMTSQRRGKAAPYPHSI